MDRKKTILAIAMSAIIFAFISGTLSFWIWQSSEENNTDVVFTIPNMCSASIDGGANISGSEVFLQPASCTNSNAAIMKEITVNVDFPSKNSNVNVELSLMVISIANELKNSLNFRYVLSTSNNSCTDNVISEGNFYNVSAGSQLSLMEKNYVTNTGDTVVEKYYLYIWLDEPETNPATANKSFKLLLNGGCSENTGSPFEAPILDDGMIPVTISNKGIVTTVDKNSTDWYDYDNKQWANAVLVSSGNTSTTAYDLSENATADTISGATFKNNGLYFDGTNDYVKLPGIDITLKTNFTVEVDFMVESLPNETVYLFTNIQVGGFSLHIGSTGKVNFQVYDADAGGYVACDVDDGTNLIVAGQRYLATGVYTGNTVVFYLNGVKLAEKSIGTLKNREDTTMTALGCNPKASACTDSYFNGYIYSARFYNRSLNSKEIVDNYNKNVTKNGLLFYYDYEYGRRVLYRNTDNVVIPASAILAYYVWIPRYKYKIWNANGTSSPQEIDIEFENKSDTVSLGTTVNSWRTHPAFWWDDDSDGVIDNNELISGIWVGKFETTGTAASPTILPNAQPLVSQYPIDEFKSSLLFAGGTLATNGDVTFGKSDIYGLSGATIDSHMMKNVDWGAVAYLSHSRYGINGEVRLNNYMSVPSNYETSSYKTGCGASSENAAGSTTCQIVYGSATSYPQSTTGNITGIFDMAGGTSDNLMSVVMDSNGNPRAGKGGSAYSGFNGVLYDGTQYTSGSDYPASKYYDLYNATETGINACNNAICYGHALDETKGWYSDRMGAFSNEVPLFVRGKSSADGADAGLFSIGGYSGAKVKYIGWRSVLVPIN